MVSTLLLPGNAIQEVAQVPGSIRAVSRYVCISRHCQVYLKPARVIYLTQCATSKSPFFVFGFDFLIFLDSKGAPDLVARRGIRMWFFVVLVMCFDELTIWGPIANAVIRIAKGAVYGRDNQQREAATFQMRGWIIPTARRVSSTCIHSYDAIPTRSHNITTVVGWRAGPGPVWGMQSPRPRWPARPRRIPDELKQWQEVGWIYWLDMARSISFWSAFIETCSPVR